MRLRHFDVQGAGRFPFHMLARDRAFPANEEEAAKIEYACPTQAPSLRIGLATYGTGGAPNIRGWAEAGWEVKYVEG